MDAVVGGLLVIAAVASASRDNSESSTSFDLYPTELGATLLVVSGVGFGISSLFGFNAMSGCRKMSAQPASTPPAPLTPPAPPAPPASTPASDAPASPPPSPPGL